MKFKTSDITKIAIFVSIMIVFSVISFAIPFTSVPISFAFLAVYLTAYLLDFRDALIVVTAYICLGAFGLPVFANFKGGYAVLFGPTGGFIWGYILMTAVISLSKGKRAVRGGVQGGGSGARIMVKNDETHAMQSADNEAPRTQALGENNKNAGGNNKTTGIYAQVVSNLRAYILPLVLGSAVCYLCGTIWFSLYNGVTIAQSLLLCVAPFVWIDLIKVGLAVIIIKRLQRIGIFY
jgi:biotin transport system substrate-specific component